MESNIKQIKYKHYIADVNNHVQNQKVFFSYVNSLEGK